VPDDLWQAAKKRQQSTRRLLASGEKLVRTRRPTFLLTGLTKCGVCGSGFTMASRDRLACAGARDRGICTNRLTIRRDDVERRVLNAMEERLWRADLFDAFYDEFTRERNRLHHEVTATAAAAAREQAKIDRELDEMVAWISTGDWRTSRAMELRVRDKMAELERRKAELVATTEAASRAQKARPLLHREMGKQYQAWVLELRDGLADDDRRAGATTALRAMVEKVVLTPQLGRWRSCCWGLGGDAGGRKAKSHTSDLQRERASGQRARHTNARSACQSRSIGRVERATE